MAPVARQKTSVLWLLDWLRDQPTVKKVSLKNETEVGFHVEVLVVPSKRLAKTFRAAAEDELGPDQDDLGERRRLLLRRLLEEELVGAPEIIDVELYGAEATAEEPRDFSKPEGFLEIPVAFYMTFKMQKKSAPTKRSPRGGVAPTSRSGGPRYVVPLDTEIEPGRPTWKANPDYPHVAKLMKDLKKLLRPRRPTLKVIARALNDKKHKTLTGRSFTEQNVDRAVVAAELLLGNSDP